MKKKNEIGHGSNIYGPNFNRSEIGRPIFFRLGFGRSRSDFFRKTTPLKTIILLSKVMMQPSETIDQLQVEKKFRFIS